MRRENNKYSFGEGCVAMMIVFAGAAIIFFIYSFIFMLAWNVLLPIFGVVQINFWQAAAFLFIINVIRQFILKNK